MSQAENMCLMSYQCDSCGELEVIWNSRPRVTPFLISCSKKDCDGTMSHVTWDKDIPAPNHLPKKDDRIFIDYSYEAAKEFNIERVNKWWFDKDYPMCKSFETKEDAVEAFMKEWFFGQPTIFTMLEDAQF